MNIGNIIADLARYRKPTVPNDNETRFLAATDNEIAKHVDTRQDLAIKPFCRVRIGEIVIAENVLPVITDRVVVSGKVVTYIGIREVIDTE